MASKGRQALRLACLFLLLAVAGCAAQPPRRAAFTPPDGHWWLAASAESRDGFDIGYDECDGTMLRWDGPSMSRATFEARVTSYYRTHPEDLDVAAAKVFARVEAPWRTSRTRPIPPDNDYDGDMWWSATAANQAGIIRGFLACQAAEQGLGSTVPVPILVQRVSRWYGVDPHKEGVVNPATIHDSLKQVILRAEKPDA